MKRFGRSMVLDGEMRVFDASDPHNPVPTYEKVIGKHLGMVPSGPRGPAPASRRTAVRYGLAAAIAAIGIGAAIGAVLPVPKTAAPLEGSRHDTTPVRPELSIPRTADYDYDLLTPGG